MVETAERYALTALWIVLLLASWGIMLGLGNHFIGMAGEGIDMIMQSESAGALREEARPVEITRNIGRTLAGDGDSGPTGDHVQNSNDLWKELFNVSVFLISMYTSMLTLRIVSYMIRPLL